MDDVREDFLGPPHDTTPAAVIPYQNKKILDTLRDKNEDGSDCRVSNYKLSSVTLKIQEDTRILFTNSGPSKGIQR